MKRKILAAALAAVMAGTMLAGCGSSGSGSDDSSAAGETAESDGGSETLDGSWPEETVKIGVEVYDTTDLSVIGYMEYFEYLEDYYNVEFMFSESISSAEEELAFVDSCYSAGCVGYIGGYNISMETVVDKVTEYGMYYWGCERGLDEEYADNEYYLGGYDPITIDGIDEDKNGEYSIGYMLAYTLAEQGTQHVVYCNGGASMGVQRFIDRQEGFADGIAAAQADGYEIQWDSETDIVEGWPGTDDFTAAQSNAIAGDYDAVACSFTGFEVWAQPLIDAGKSETVKLAGLGEVSDSLLELFDSGMISLLIYECPEITFGQAFPMIMNAIEGNADLIKGDEGYMALPVNRWYITDAEDYQAIYDFHESGNYYVTADDIAALIEGLTEGVTRNDIINYYSGLSLDACVE